MNEAALSSKTVFYLKINATEDSDLKCFCHWVEIADAMGYEYYVVVDKDSVEAAIRNLCRLSGYTEPREFIPSYREELETACRSFVHDKWLNVAYALLTPSVHAKRNHIDFFWNIDADDTFFHESPQDCALMLLEAEQYAKNHDIDIFSFDMWHSLISHWSFGISFSNNCDWVACVEKGIEWLRATFGGEFDIKQYCVYFKHDMFMKLSVNCNLDAYFNFLIRYSMLNARCFYCENVLFEHVGHRITFYGEEIFYGLAYLRETERFLRGDGVVKLARAMPLKSLSQFLAAFLERAFVRNIGLNVEDVSKIDNIILFGCGENGGIARTLLKKIGANVTYFCDNNPDLWGYVCDGLPIISPDKLCGMDGTVMITTSIDKYRNEIKCQLEDYGIKYLSFTVGVTATCI
ncbi:MAG: hypothetical protein LBG71_02470 [Clostridiales Family XIII bacterium]|nr:hypothetical protein [Clostridiales Family XIII bacterium]